MQDNPLHAAAPDDPIARVHDFARDLAYGVAQGLWGTTFSVFPRAGGPEWSMLEERGDFRPYLGRKWDHRPPSVDLLLSFEYVQVYEEKQYHRNYLLTKRAFTLLEKPMAAPSVFVSYRRRESSALALLVEARLKLADPTIEVFVDKDIPVGENWERILRDQVEQARYVVPIIGPHTLASEHVMDEITWALGSQTTLITMLLPGYHFGTEPDPNPRAAQIITRLQAIQSIPIKTESAEDYDAAIRRLLNTLGYATL